MKFHMNEIEFGTNMQLTKKFDCFVNYFLQNVEL